MKKIWIPVFIAAVACLAGTAAAQRGGSQLELPDTGVVLPHVSIPLSSWGTGAVELAHCFTLEATGQCGQDAVGDSITCTDGSSGPGWVITADETYKCMECPQGQGGQRKCNSTTGKAYMKIQRFGCPRGSWGPLGDPFTLSTCQTAELSGNDCEG